MSRKNKISQRRIDANRANAQKSTGPRTVEGKVKSSRNAITHGLAALQTNPLAKGCFLQTEDETQFCSLLGEYVATYCPQHRDEYDLLSEAVYAKWRQQRMWLAETAQIEVAIARHESSLQKELPLAEAGAHLANGIAHSADLMRLYLRYGAQLHRQYLRCLKELRDLQTSRHAPRLPPNNPSRSEDTPPATDPGPQQAEQNGSPNEANAIKKTTEPNGAILSPEQARLQYMKAEIRRFTDHQTAVWQNK